MTAAQTALVSRPALAGAVLLVALACAAPAQAGHRGGGFVFGFAAPYPAPVVSYPAGSYYYYYYYPTPQYYYPPPAAYYAPPAAYYAPTAAYTPPPPYYPSAAAYSSPPAPYGSPPTGYSPLPAGYSPAPAADHAPQPAANNLPPPAGKATQVTAGQDCHQAWHTISIDGRSVSAYGTLCRQPDGSFALLDPFNGSVASSR